jgi:hypothetical protein
MSDPALTSPQKPRVWIFSGIGIFVAAIAGLVIWAGVHEGEKPAPKVAASAGADTPRQPPAPAKFRVGPLKESTTTLSELPPKSTMSLEAITSEEVPDENLAKHLRLHIPIKARQGLQIDLHDLVIHVLFYDQLDGKDVVETAAKVNTHWAKPPVDWADSDVEELVVDYELPKPDRAEGERHDRQYYGYIVRVYYQRQLQGATAQPVLLAQNHPAEPALPDESLRISPRRPSPVLPPPEPVDLSEAVPDIAAGSAMGILPITSDSITDPKALQHFTLHIPIKVRPKVRVDVKEVMVQVLFYDLSDGGAVVQTCANVKSHWDSPPADWTHTNIEDLNVDYQLMRPQNRTTALNENRQYYGYVVRVYYRKRLQATTAQPSSLAQKYPSPPILEEPESAAE